jgi:hypothetical protein
MRGGNEKKEGRLDGIKTEGFDEGKKKDWRGMVRCKNSKKRVKEH